MPGFTFQSYGRCIVIGPFLFGALSSEQSHMLPVNVMPYSLGKTRKEPINVYRDQPDSQGEANPLS